MMIASRAAENGAVPRFGRLILPILIASRVFAGAAYGVESFPIEVKTANDNVKCFVCHDRPEMKEKLSDGRLKSYFVDPAEYRDSTHGKNPCTSCHKDITRAPHAPGRKTVNCTGCHYMENVYGAPASEADIERYELYRKSVHKRALDNGNPDAPNCYDCHGSHDIIPPSRKESRINRRNIPRTCGRCHIDEYATYKTSIHGEALENGIMEAAVCTDCHGEHGTVEIKRKGSTVSAVSTPETCRQCHAEEKLMSRFNIKATYYATYRESYHGKANRFGVEVVANCASCHGYHDIRPRNDPKSSIHPANLPATCGKCHRGANINYTRGRMHIEASDPSSGIVFWVALAFKILTGATIAALVAHIALDLMRRLIVRGRNGR
ncbi:MAG: cytochrome c3 family protein [bacterium]